MIRLLLILLLLGFSLSGVLTADATTYYARPGFDSLRVALTYGTGDGLSKANAKAGFSWISAGTPALAPDDIVCLSDENYYGEQVPISTGTVPVSGTAGHPITFRGCDAVVSGDSTTSTGKALFWSASDITGDRSYTAAKATVNGAAYEWVTVATDIYRKRIDRRPRQLWEDGTWLEPFYTGGATAPFSSIDALSEATIIATLPAGKWGNKNNGDGTFRLYYHSTTGSKNPTNTTIRTNSIPLDNAGGLVQLTRDYYTFEDIEFRGHMSGTNPYCLNTANASHLTVTRVKFWHCEIGIGIRATTEFVTDVLLKDLEVVNSESIGVAMRGGAAWGVQNFTVDGGTYSYSNAFTYNGTAFVGVDGDALGNGWEGGANSNFVFKNFTCEGNFNYCIFYGTNVVMTMQNLTIESVYMGHNRRGCFGEGTNDRVQGTLRISGVVCAYSRDLTGMQFYGPALVTDVDVFTPISPAIMLEFSPSTVREVILENITFVGNRNKERLYLLNDANGHFHVKNVVFWDNPGHATNDNGDLFILGATALDANDTFQNIHFSSAPNQNRVIVRNNATSTYYRYNSASDKTALTAFLTGTNLVYDTDPLLTSATDFRPQLLSTLLQSGLASTTCRDVRSTALSCSSPPDRGAYQTQTGDPSDSSGSPPNITTTTLPGGTVTIAYSQQLGRSSGTSPFVWSLQSGALPTGLSMDADGLITGTPTTPGLYTFTPQVTDAIARTDTTPPQLTITITANPIVITTAALLSGNVNRAYSQAMTATGGNGAITWSLVSGTFPTGLSMNSAGAITGTPSGLEVSTVTIRATDNVGTTKDAQFTLSILAALVLSTPDVATCPSTVVSPYVCWFVRPDTDGITDLNYGAEDGTSYATAFDGMAAITGMAPGDVVCFPGAGEPFYEIFQTMDVGKDVNGTNGHPITYQGCGTTKSLWWSARLFTNDRSYDAARATVTGSAYEWVALGNDVYRKKIEIIPKMLWAGDTWIQPRVIYTMTEAQILAFLAAGEWGVRDFGDATYRVYYRASSSSHSPAHDVMRIDFLAATGAFGHVRQNFLALKHIEMRGHRSPSSARTIQIFDAHHVTFEDMLYYRNQEGPAIAGNGVTFNTTDILFKDLDVLYNSANGPHLSPGVASARWTFDGGNYSYNGFSGDEHGSFIGTGWDTQADGDGIGIGQSGGLLNEVVIKNIHFDGNSNYAVFVGTSNPMTVTNFSLLSSFSDGNFRGCFSEGSGADIVGRLIVSGMLCTNTVGDDPLSATMHFSSSTLVAPREVVVQNITFAGNYNASRIEFEANINGGWNRYTFRNLVFGENFDNAVGQDHGDFYSFTTTLTGTEIFDRIYFYSKPNTDGRFAELKIVSTNTPYLYNVAGDMTSFVSATGATNLVINTDPLFLSTTDFRLKPTSPLRNTATVSGYCVDVRGRSCRSDHQDIGAYQATSGDQAVTRSPITQPRLLRSTNP